jgi:hypothetical protein
MPNFFLQKRTHWLIVAMPISPARTTERFSIIMAELFDINRTSFVKIFETHQFKGLISFSDVLKICNTLKLFPELLDAQDVQKALANFVTGSAQKITFLEFEEFLKRAAVVVFGNTGKSDCLEVFLAHIKSFALKAYGVEVRTLLRKQRSLSKYLRAKKEVGTGIKHRSAAKLPETTRNISGRKIVFENSQNGAICLKKKKKESKIGDLTERRVELSKIGGENGIAGNIERAGKMIKKLKGKVEKCGKKGMRTRGMQNCNRIVNEMRNRYMIVGFYFQVWKWSV